MASLCDYCGEEACFVHCIYCLTDCSIDEPEHGAACPSVTGRFPVFHPRRFDPDCVPECCGPDATRPCCRCEATISDFYYLVLLPGESNVYESVCFECKIAAEVTA